MPELPDVTVYVEALRRHVLDRTLERARLKSVFLVRTPEPPLSDAEGRRVVEVDRIGKRILFGMEDDLFLVFHFENDGRGLADDNIGPDGVRLGCLASGDQARADQPLVA